MAEYIEREAAHRMITGLTRYSWASPISSERRVTVDADDVNFGLDKIPAADVAPVVHGRWKYHKYVKKYECVECGHFVRAGTNRNYCPNCGAKMDKEE